jgi:hypothetical protein
MVAVSTFPLHSGERDRVRGYQTYPRLSSLLAHIVKRAS